MASVTPSSSPAKSKADAPAPKPPRLCLIQCDLSRSFANGNAGVTLRCSLSSSMEVVTAQASTVSAQAPWAPPRVVELALEDPVCLAAGLAYLHVEELPSGTRKLSRGNSSELQPAGRPVAVFNMETLTGVRGNLVVLLSDGTVGSIEYRWEHHRSRNSLSSGGGGGAAALRKGLPRSALRNGYHLNVSIPAVPSSQWSVRVTDEHTGLTTLHPVDEPFSICSATGYETTTLIFELLHNVVTTGEMVAEEAALLMSREEERGVFALTTAQRSEMVIHMSWAYGAENDSIATGLGWSDEHGSHNKMERTVEEYIDRGQLRSLTSLTGKVKGPHWEPRNLFGATLTSVGTRCYLIGGLNEAGLLESAMAVYAVESRQWGRAMEPQTLLARYGHSTVVISSRLGTLCVFGGVGLGGFDPRTVCDEKAPHDPTAMGYLSDACIIDTRNGDVHLLALRQRDTDAPVDHRFQHTAEEYGGEMFVFGGWTMRIRQAVMGDRTYFEADEVLCDPQLQCIDLTSGEAWTVVKYTGLLPGARAAHASASYGGKMYIHGGVDAFGNVFSDLYTYDFVHSLWNEVTVYGPTKSPAMYGHTIATTEDGTMVVIGRRWNPAAMTARDTCHVYEYHPNEQFWLNLPMERLSLGGDRLHCCAVDVSRKRPELARRRLEATATPADILLVGGLVTIPLSPASTIGAPLSRTTHQNVQIYRALVPPGPSCPWYTARLSVAHADQPVELSPAARILQERRRTAQIASSFRHPVLDLLAPQRAGAKLWETSSRLSQRPSSAMSNSKSSINRSASTDPSASIFVEPTHAATLRSGVTRAQAQHLDRLSRQEAGRVVGCHLAQEDIPKTIVRSIDRLTKQTVQIQQRNRDAAEKRYYPPRPKSALADTSTHLERVYNEGCVKYTAVRDLPVATAILQERESRREKEYVHDAFRLDSVPTHRIVRHRLDAHRTESRAQAATNVMHHASARYYQKLRELHQDEAKALAEKEADDRRLQEAWDILAAKQHNGCRQEQWEETLARMEKVVQ